MTARLLDIEAKVRAYPLSVASPADFRTRDAGPVVPEIVVDRPTISLYCLDHAKRQALFTECPERARIHQAPFLYQAQYEAAWAGAEASHAQGRQLLDDLTRVGLHPQPAGSVRPAVPWTAPPSCDERH